jgi:long-chain fatty acid transport protein
MSGTAKNQLLGLLGGPTSTDFDRDVAWPMWLAAGLAFKPADNLTITVDAQMSQWKESSDVFQTDYKDPTWKAATGQTGDDKFELHWKNATQFRMGAEYWLSDQFALRGGYYYDPAPAPDETLIFLFPSSTNDVATLGASFKTGNIDINFGMEYLFGQERIISADFVDNNPMLGFKNAQPGKHHMDVFAFSLGVALGL